MKDTQDNASKGITGRFESIDPDHLYLDESQIPGAGKGLYTDTKILKDEIIALFNGEFLTDEEVEIRSAVGDGNYFIEMLDGSTLDCSRVHGFAKYANDAKGLVKSNFKNNSIITFDDEGNVCIVAKRTIKAGEEIFCGYGAAYWK